jgi:excisionase family DNA binding protein
MPYSNNISIKETARLVGMSESTIRRWVKEAVFPLPFKVGGRTFFYKPEVDGWLAEKREHRGFQEAFVALEAMVRKTV